MDYTEITVTVSGENAEIAAAIMQAVSSGIYIEDYRNLEEEIFQVAHTDLIDDELLKADRENIKIHVYISVYDNPTEKLSFIKERLNEQGFCYEINVGEICGEDWANNWKQYYKPFQVGKRLLIKPEWEDVEDAKGRHILNIEPGLAFGTGTHESTKMCLELLEESVSEGERVLDIGCGTGILSIAALLLGAGSATAIDIDPVAVKAAGQNAALNETIRGRLKIIEGNLVDELKDGEKYDIIIANIVADVIIALLPMIAAFMEKDCLFICSGIIDDKLGAVLSALKENGYELVKVCEEKGWAAALAKH